jgi:hypothetical protein
MHKLLKTFALFTVLLLSGLGYSQSNVKWYDNIVLDNHVQFNEAIGNYYRVFTNWGYDAELLSSQAHTQVYKFSRDGESYLALFLDNDVETVVRFKKL